MINNFQREIFCGFFKEYKCHKKGDIQEFDNIIVLGEHRAFIVVEVKSGKKYKTRMKKSLVKGREMYHEIISYIKQKDLDLDFSDWKCITILAMPNCDKNPKLLDHLFMTRQDFRKDFKSLFNLKQSYEIREEYKYIAALMLSSAHSASITTTEGIPELSQPLSQESETQDQLSPNKSDGPRFNDDLSDSLSRMKLTESTYSSVKRINKEGNEKLTANSYPAWMFWNPAQARIINQDHKRLIIHGTYGTGKSQVLMALALNAVKRGEKVCYFVFLKDSILCSSLKQFCNLHNIDYCEPDWNKYPYDSPEYWPLTLMNTLQLHCYDMVCIDEFNGGFVTGDNWQKSKQAFYERACDRFFQWLSKYPISNLVKRVACVIAPCKYDIYGEGPIVSYLKITQKLAWEFLKLTSNMRNPANIANFAGKVSLTRKQLPTVAVLGPKPCLLKLNDYNHLYIGLEKALELLENEIKVVIIAGKENKNSIKDRNLHISIRNYLSLYNLPYFTADEFNSRDSGYWILSPEQFEGMETRTLILVDMIGVDRVDYRLSNITRCTCNLIIISDYDFLPGEALNLCKVI